MAEIFTAQTTQPSGSPVISRAASVSAATTAPAEDPILKLEFALESEAKDHREYLKTTFDHLIWAVGILVTLGLALGAGGLTWMNYRSQKDVRTQVNARFKTSVEAIVNERLEKFDDFLASRQEKVGQSIGEMSLLLNRTSDFTSAWTFAYLLLERASTGDRNNLAVKDAMRQLEAVRVDFPHWRHVGIMLARLHVYFGNYGPAIEVLTQVVLERDKRDLPHGIDYAALLYSRACYRNRVAEQWDAKSEEQADALRKTAWEDLNCSVKCDPGNREETDGDKDLDTLWNNTTRKKESLGNSPDGENKESKPNLLSRAVGWFRD